MGPSKSTILSQRKTKGGGKLREGLAQTVSLVNRVFGKLPKRGRFDENSAKWRICILPTENKGFARRTKTTKMTKVAGVTQAKAWFRKSLVCFSLTGEAKHTKEPLPKNCFGHPHLWYDSPPLCSRSVIFLRGNGNRPDQVHFLANSIPSSKTSFGARAIVRFPPPPPQKIAWYTFGSEKIHKENNTWTNVSKWLPTDWNYFGMNEAITITGPLPTFNWLGINYGLQIPIS